MSKIIINNRSSHDIADVIRAVAAVISAGRVSDDGQCYCYVTTFSNGLEISAKRNKDSDTFICLDYPSVHPIF